MKEGEQLLRRLEAAKKEKENARREIDNIMQRKEAARSVSCRAQVYDHFNTSLQEEDGG